MVTGVRQGSVEGPSLWLLFYSLLLHDFRDRCWHRVAGFGVPWLTNRHGVLRNPIKMRQAAASRIHLRDVVFADDTLLLDNNWANFQSVASLFDEVLDDYGSTLSFVKTEWMMLSSAGSLADAAPLPGCRVLRVWGVGLPRTAVFRYLGSYVGCDASLGVHLDISKRIGLAHGVFSQLLDSLVDVPKLSCFARVSLLSSCLVPSL